MIQLTGSAIEVHVDPDRGAQLTHISQPGGSNVLFWDGARSPLPSSRSTSYGSTDADWLSEYRGGWQELFPNAGAACEVMGVPLPFHGEASSARWDIEESTPTSLTVSTPTRLPFVIQRRLDVDPDRSVLSITETVRNESNLDLPYIWGHHPAFDAVPGSTIDLPGGTAQVPDDFDPVNNDLRPGGSGAWPFVPGKDGAEVDLRVVPDGPRERVAYIVDVADGWVSLRQPTGIGVALAWDHTTFPHMWCWTEIGGEDFPWFGRSRIVALEPAMSWPNDGLSRALERGRARHLGKGAEVTSWLTLALYDSDDRPVTHVYRDGLIDRAST